MQFLCAKARGTRRRVDSALLAKMQECTYYVWSKQTFNTHLKQPVSPFHLLDFNSGLLQNAGYIGLLFSSLEKRLIQFFPPFTSFRLNRVNR